MLARPRPAGTAPAEVAPPAAPAWPTWVEAAHAAARTCRDCSHRLPRGTCREPEAAGLFPPGHGFGIAWGDDEHAETCPAFVPKVPTEAAGRPYRVTRVEGYAAHADAWPDAAIARFLARVASIRRRGFDKQDADDLAERLHLLDVPAEGRSLCLACSHLPGSVANGWRCGNHRAADVPRELAPELVTTATRCTGRAADWTPTEGARNVAPPDPTGRMHGRARSETRRPGAPDSLETRRAGRRASIWRTTSANYSPAWTVASRPRPTSGLWPGAGCRRCASCCASPGRADLVAPPARERARRPAAPGTPGWPRARRVTSPAP